MDEESLVELSKCLAKYDPSSGVLVEMSGILFKLIRFLVDCNSVEIN